jgi:hypothetical protein
VRAVVAVAKMKITKKLLRVWPNFYMLRNTPMEADMILIDFQQKTRSKTMRDEFYSFEMLVRMYKKPVGFVELLLSLIANEENQ